jgi:tetratricopeptide (TPR) repeat protein
MRLPKKKTILLSILVALALLAGAYEGLIHPKNYFSRLFRGPVTDIGDKVILGPYPGDDDFKFLADQKIGTIVSLLDARLPYEGDMLEQERARAERSGIRLLNFPLGSVLGRHYGADFDAQAQAAAEAIAAAPGRVYMHCYLGRHRAVAVQEKLAALGTKAVSIGAGERSPELILNDQAWAKLNAGDNRGVLDLLAGKPDLGATAHVIAGWAHYRMGELAPALESFKEALALEPGNVDAHGGLAYVAMMQNRLDDADKEFAGALAQAPDDLQSLLGMGLLRNRQGRAREAADYMEKVLRIEPNNEEARGVLGHVDPLRLRSAATAGR